MRHATKRRVLIVDNEPRLLCSLARHLKRSADLRTASGFVEAKAILADFIPDVVLTGQDPPAEAVELVAMAAREVPTTGMVGPPVTRSVVVNERSFPHPYPIAFLAYARTW